MTTHPGLLASVATAAAAAGLVGCAAPKPTVPRYVSPTGVPTAKLVMRGAALTPTDGYGVYVHDDAANCKGQRMAGAGAQGRNPTTVELAAGQLATVDYVLVKGIRTDKPQVCTVRWSFTPEAGKSYLVVGQPTPTGCSARVLDASNPDAMKAPPQVAQRNPPGSTCLPLAQALAAAKAAGAQADGAAVLRPSATTDDLQGLIGP